MKWAVVLVTAWVVVLIGLVLWSSPAGAQTQTEVTNWPTYTGPTAVQVATVTAQYSEMEAQAERTITLLARFVAIVEISLYLAIAVGVWVFVWRLAIAPVVELIRGRRLVR